MKTAVFGIICAIIPLGLMAQLNKGYGQLERGEYPEAKVSFTKYRENCKPGSSSLTEAYFSLYNYYSAEGNTNNDLDKAWLYLDSASNNIKENEDFKVRYLPFEDSPKMNKAQMVTLKADMESKSFKKAITTNTVAGWKKYIAFYKPGQNTERLKKAEEALNHKAFEDCAKKNDITCLESFIDEYKTAAEVDSAMVLIDKLRWKYTLAANTHDAYQLFIKTYPENDMIEEATDSLSAIDYRAIAGETNTMPFKAYLATYPNSKFKATAQARICQLTYDSVVTANKEEGLRNFAANYPGCPQINLINDKLEKAACEKCFAAPNKECLLQVMKTYGTDIAFVKRVNEALFALMDRDKTKQECESCFTNPTKTCLIQIYKKFASDSTMMERANTAFSTVIDRERDKAIKDSLSRSKAPSPIKKTTHAAEIADKPKVDTSHIQSQGKKPDSQ